MCTKSKKCSVLSHLLFYTETTASDKIHIFPFGSTLTGNWTEHKEEHISVSEFGFRTQEASNTREPSSTRTLWGVQMWQQLTKAQRSLLRLRLWWKSCITAPGVFLLSPQWGFWDLSGRTEICKHTVWTKRFMSTRVHQIIWVSKSVLSLWHSYLTITL